MPPMVESESVDWTGDEVDIVEKTRKEVAATQDQDVDMNGSKEDEVDEPDTDKDQDEDDNEDEEAYQVENILAHDFVNGQCMYEVKWLGYDRKEDNTWEPEENLQGAIDVLEEYHRKIGGKPLLRSKEKKRGRPSTGGKADAGAKKARTGIESGRKSGRGRRSAAAEEDDERETPDLRVPDSWTPPVAKKDSWEDMVVQVETIEADEHNVKWAFLHWAYEDDNGKQRRSKALLETVHKAAPQAMLQFYERHLVFTDKSKPNGT